MEDLKTRIGILFILLSAALTPAPSHAAIELGSDLFLSGILLGNANEVHLRTRNSLYIGVGSVAVGAIFRFEPQHSYLQDYGAGASVRMGQDFTVELEGGMLRRHFESLWGDGLFFSAIFGWQLSKTFRLAIPITAKQINLGTDSGWTVDYLPYIGVRVVF